MAVMRYLSSSSGLGVPVGFAKFNIARWTIFKFLNFACCSSFSGVIGMSLDKILFILTCSRLRYEKKESMISPSLHIQGSSLLYSGKEETVRQQKPLGTCVSINFVVFPASISSFSRKLSKSAKMANGTFI